MIVEIELKALLGVIVATVTGKKCGFHTILLIA